MSDFVDLPIVTFDPPKTPDEKGTSTYITLSVRKTVVAMVNPITVAPVEDVQSLVIFTTPTKPVMCTLPREEVLALVDA